MQNNNQAVIEWLLQEENPSVRYFNLTEILGYPQPHLHVMQSKEAIMERGVIPKIMAKQHNNGYWESPTQFYSAKYKGTVWQLIILAELGADDTNQRIKNACEFVLQNSQDPESGGFSTRGTSAGGDHDKVIPCLTGNMVFSLIRLGYLNDRRVQKGINWITTYQRFDDGIEKRPTGWPYDRWQNCWGKHTCHMGVVKALKALAEIPANKRSPVVNQTIEKGAEYLLTHHIYKKSHDLTQVSKPKWLQLGFPWMANTDVLEILDILTRLGYKDDRMQEAVNLVKSKQDAEGKWILESTYNGRFQTNIEQKGRQSKWVTLNALKALKKFYT